MILLLVHLLIDLSLSDITCNNQSQCAGEFLHNSGVVYCRGFDSCSKATTITAGSNFYANGGYSAHGATNVSSGGNSNCWGESSCSAVNFAEIYGNTGCYGCKSCFTATIVRTTDSSSSSSYKNIFFDGYKSGAYSTLNLYQSTNIYVRAALALYNASINMHKSSKIYARQDFALIGANVFCATGQTCTIECVSYGCANVFSATGDGTYSVDCTKNSVSNIFCNTSNNITHALVIDLDNDLPSELIETMIDPDINDDLKSQNEVYLMYKNLSNFNCGDYQECENERLNSSNQAIICSGEKSCQYGSGLLTINFNSTIAINSSNLIGIYCGGYIGCEDEHSPTNQFVINKSSLNPWLKFESDIHCDGFAGCRRVILNGANNLFCGGFYGCYASTISSINKIVGSGRASISFTNISNIAGDIYCIAYRACEGAVMNQIGGNVYGFGYQSMRRSSIIANSVTNANYSIIEKIYIIGYQAGRLITVGNVKSMYASGYQVLEYSVISGIRNLYVNGTDALTNSSVITQLSINDTNSDHDSRVILDIAGTNSNLYNVLCSSGDECFIYCRSSTSCTKMNLVCNGICYLDCGNYSYIYDNNECPENIIGTWYGETPNPTQPSYEPTRDPTIIPSKEPTTIPSANPTGDHTIIPTIIPTMNPTADPSSSMLFSTTTSTVFNFVVVLDLLFNSTMKQHSAKNLDTNVDLKNDIIIVLEEASNWIVQIQDSDMETNIHKIWDFNGTVNNNCQLENTNGKNDIVLAESELYYISWIRLFVAFVNSNDRDEWKDELEDIINVFSIRLSESDYFVNDTISIAYCVIDSSSTTVDKNTNDLELFSIIITISIIGCLMCIAIFGCIDATFCRKNEVFSVGAIMSATSYTVDIVSGLCRLCFQFCFLFAHDLLQ